MQRARKPRKWVSCPSESSKGGRGRSERSDTFFCGRDPLCWVPGRAVGGRLPGSTVCVWVYVHTLKCFELTTLK